MRMKGTLAVSGWGWWGWALLVAGLARGGGGARADEPVVVETEGEAVVVGGNRSLAERLARREAMRRAISRAATEVLETPEAKRRFEARRDGLWEELEAACTDFDVFETTLAAGGGSLKLFAVATFDRSRLRRVAAGGEEGAARKGKPRVLVVIDEEIQGLFGQAGLKEDLRQAESVVADLLGQRGYSVVDAAQVRKKLVREQAVQELAGNRREAAALAFQYGADLIVTGRAVARPSGVRFGDLKGQAANVALKAIEADTGRVLASGAASAAKAHIDEVSGGRLAIAEAAGQAAGALAAELSGARGGEESRAIELTLARASQYQLALVKEGLRRAVPEIRSLRQTGFAGSVGTFEIETSLSVEALADRLVLEDFGEFRVRVDALTGSKLEATLVLKPAAPGAEGGG